MVVSITNVKSSACTPDINKRACLKVKMGQAGKNNFLLKKFQMKIDEINELMA